jgi:hypothetical protein
MSNLFIWRLMERPNYTKAGKSLDWMSALSFSNKNFSPWSNRPLRLISLSGDWFCYRGLYFQMDSQGLIRNRDIGWFIIIMIQNMVGTKCIRQLQAKPIIILK